MGRIICKLGDRYFEFSTVVEGAVTDLMSEEEYQEYSLKLYGETYVEREMPARMKRANERGNSDMVGGYESLEEFLKMNTLNSVNRCDCRNEAGELLDEPEEECEVDHWPGLHEWAVQTWGQDYDKQVDGLQKVVMPRERTTGEST